MLVESFLALLLLFLAKNWFTLLFYLAVVLLIYANRKRFDWPARFMGLYRTKIGLKAMERLGRHERTVKLLGYIGIVVGFAGMLLISLLLLKGVYDFLFVPTAPPTVAPVIPGVTIPGLGIKVPLITGWVALFIVMVIHEFSHGVVARAHRIKVESSGLMVMGPLGGAFVEPSEKQINQASPKVQLSIFAAGPFSNVVTAFLFILLASFLLAPLAASMVHPVGVEIAEVFPDGAAAAAYVPSGATLASIGNRTILTNEDVTAALAPLRPGDEALLATADGASYRVTLGGHPDNGSKAYLGIAPRALLEANNPAWWYGATQSVVAWLAWLLFWVYLLSLGIGLANLLPIAITDGGRMFQVVAAKWFGEERGKRIWLRAGAVTLVVVLALLVGTIVKAVI